MIDLTFKVDHISLNIKNLIGKSKNNSQISQLIDHIKSKDTSYEMHEPMDEDIANNNDKWEVYMAFNDGLVFEFLEDKLIYIAFDLRFVNKDIIALSADIQSLYSVERLDMNRHFTQRDGCFQKVLDSNMVLALIQDEQQNKKVKLIAFGDFNVFSNEERLPNRYSEILGGLIVG